MLIARQPVFDQQGKVFGYELLYRETGEDRYQCEDDSLATSRVIAGSFLSASFHDLVGDSRAFIHFTEELLLNDTVTLFPSHRLVLEIGELDRMKSQELPEALSLMKEQGYTLAFDQTVLLPGHESLLRLADIIKIDTMNNTPEQCRAFILKFGGRIRFMAIKLETRNSYEAAKEAGFHLFQGYFFAKPDLLKGDTLSPLKISALRMIRALQEKELDIHQVTAIIEQDVSFSYEILKLINSAFFYRGNRIHSVREAVVRLGEREIRKWGMITALRKAVSEDATEALNFSLVRARFMEKAAILLRQTPRSSEYLTVGILSMVDVLMNVPMDKVLEDLKMPEEIESALLRKHPDSDIELMYMAIMACEQGDWGTIRTISDKTGIPLLEIANLHNEAIKWTLDFQKGLNI